MITSLKLEQNNRPRYQPRMDDLRVSLFSSVQVVFFETGFDFI